jgi:hypothetical protein
MPPSDGSSSALTAIFASYFAVVAVVTIAAIVFNIIVYWRICSKAGYSGAMSLLIFVPFGALIMMCILAFGDWPALRGLNQSSTGMPVGQINQYPAQAPYQQPPQPYAQSGQYPPQGQYPQQGQYSQPGQYPGQGQPFANNDPRYQ